jgi:hypothetical protein
MPITSSNPTIKDGVEYPYFGVNLAISPLWTNPEYVGGTVAMRLVPYRMDQNNLVDKLDDADKAVVYLDVFKDAENDPGLASAVTKIMQGIQEFIIVKGL